MYSVIKKIFSETLAPWKAFVLGGLLGLALFLSLYGVYTLNPTDISWMYNVLGTDITISNNWAFYRNSPWLWPFGLFEGLGSQPMSLVYLESGPLYAVFFKIFSPLLPQTFYYLGPMQCINFILQGALGALIGRFFFANLRGALLGAGGFLFTLPLAQRSFYHPTLGQQWIILLALLAWLYKDRLWRTPLWLVLLPLSLYMHPYFFPIIFVVFAGVYGEDILKEFKTKKFSALASAVAVLAFTAFHIYLLGIFSAGRGENSGYFGTFGAPPLSLFVPWSRHDLPNGSPFGLWKVQITEGMRDGNPYLGFGWLVGLALGLVLFLSSKEKPKGTQRGWLMFAVAVGIYIASWGLPPGINEKEIFSFLRSLRSSNRFAWLALYLIIIFIFTQMRDRLKGKGTAVLGLLVLVQIVDMFPAFTAHRDLFTSRIFPKKEAPFQNPLWQRIARDYSKIFFIPEKNDKDVIYKAGSWESSDVGLLTLFAGLHKLSMSDATLGGWNRKALAKALEQEQVLLDAGTPDEKTLYVFKTLPDPRPEGLYFYRLDGVLFGSPHPLDAPNIEKL